MNRRTFIRNITTSSVVFSSLVKRLFGYRDHPVSLTFFGATPPIVSGSSIMLSVNGRNILIDCGAFYEKEYRDLNDELYFDPKILDTVIVSHPHLDHVGRVPMLYEKGYDKYVIMTDIATKIAKVMIDMHYRIQNIEIDRKIYSKPSLNKFLTNIINVSARRNIQLYKNIKFKFLNSAHILGSNYINFDIYGKNVAFAFDIGPKDTFIHKPPDYIDKADTLILETTNGSKNTVNMDYEKVGKSFKEVLDRDGSILIPCFILEKTQKILFVIRELKERGLIPVNTQVFLDSKVAHKLNNIYRQHPEFYNSVAIKAYNKSGDIFHFPNLFEMNASKTLKMHRKTKGIFITSDGMLDHGNSPKHLVQMISDTKNKIFIIGFTAPESLARKLQNGEKEVEVELSKFYKKRIISKRIKKEVKIEIETLPYFTSHACGDELLEWISKIKGLKNIFLVHGSNDNALSLKTRIEKELNKNVIIPERLKSYTV